LSRHYVVVLTKAEREALLSLLEPVIQNRQDYGASLYRSASAAYDRLLLKAKPWAPIARGLREAVGVATAGEEEVEGQHERIAPAQSWLDDVP
jgi:hypothetical protein